MPIGRLLTAILACLGLTGPAAAHFQLIYSPQTHVERPGDVPVKLIFWHPFENGHVMDMGAPLEFYAINRGTRIELKDRLVPATFTGNANAAAAWDGTVPVKRSGDYVLVLVPAPYYEQSEDIYIQQITKSYLNRALMPSDWAEPQGLPTEIVPLNRPTNVLAGSTFAGRVIADGKPVAGAEIEIEYIAAEPDMDAGRPGAVTAAPPPGGALVAIADEDGYFSFGVPRAGFWGFAALGVGPETEYQGKTLSQDAVIWIRAWEME